MCLITCGTSVDPDQPAHQCRSQVLIFRIGKIATVFHPKTHLHTGNLYKILNKIMLVRI
jgi:hypothetical protein